MIITCLIPKVGSSNFRGMILRQTGQVPVNKTLRNVHVKGMLQLHGLHPLHNYPQTEKNPVYKNT